MVFTNNNKLVIINLTKTQSAQTSGGVKQNTMKGETT